MKRFITILFLLSLTACQDDETENTVDVYISAGAKFCSDDSLSVTETQSYLTDAGIKVNKSDCGILTTPLANVPVCGDSTYDVHVYNIPLNDFSQAENIGFTDAVSISEDVEVGSNILIETCKNL